MNPRPSKSTRRAAVAAFGVLAMLSAPAAAAPAPRQLVVAADFAGLAAKDNQTLGVPPDTTGAIGPADYVEVVNARIAVYRRGQTSPAAERDAAAFWGVEPALPVDPQVAWDGQSHRWYLVGFSSGGGRPSELMVAWSKTPDPANLLDGWCRMYLPSGGNDVLIDDFPKLGYDADHLIIGTNVGDVVQRKVIFSRVWVIAQPKAVPGGCDTPAYTVFGSARNPLPVTGNRPAFTPVPVRPVGATSVGYVVAAQCVVNPLEDKDDRPEDDCGTAGNLIDVWRVTGPPDAPRLTLAGTVPVPAYRVPAPVPQPGVPQRLDAGDTRLLDATSAPDPALGGRTLIWTQHDIAGPGGRSQVAWYAIDPQRLALVDSGVVAVPGQWAFNGAISPTSRGDQAVLDYDVGGPALLPEIRARIAGQPRTEVTLATSAAPDQLCDPPPADAYCPWGDYAGASPDPTQPDAVWGSNQTIAPRDQADQFGIHWRTSNFELSVHQLTLPTAPPPTAAPSHPPVIGPAPPPAGPVAATLAVTGSPVRLPVIAGLLLLAAGATLVLAGHRRRP